MDLNKLTKQQLKDLARLLKPGSDISRLKKFDMIKFIKPHLRNKLLEDILK